MTRRPPAPGQPRSPWVTFVIALVVLLAVAGAGAWRAGLIGSQGVAAEDLRQVVLIAAAPDENGAVLAQVVTIVDVGAASPTVMPVSVETSVAIPGTSYETLADAYAFGGGAGTAAALASSTGGEPLPYVTLGPEVLRTAVAQSGAVSLQLPAPMSVFDGERLFTFAEGPGEFDADELGALFKGAPYLADTERGALDAELARVLVELTGTVGYADVDTDLSQEAFTQLAAAVGGLR